MKNNKWLKTIESVDTPAYLFDIDEFNGRIDVCKELFPNTPITFSIKANPYLVGLVGDGVSHFEVCSPGELEICISHNVPSDKIIYSGVNKELSDIKRAMEYGCDIVTAESILHVKYEQEVAQSIGKEVKILLRLTSGNQFGMSSDVIKDILSHKEDYPNLIFMGFHYYSGTQKKLKQVLKDISSLEEFLIMIKSELAYEPKLVEYGAGLSFDYFNLNQVEEQDLTEIAKKINELAKEWPIGLEFGRFIASSCGYYATTIKDIKVNDGINYVICDGGIHQLRYYGQTLAMQVPKIELIKKDESDSSEKQPYCICGSLCTVADVLVREVMLPKLEIGDILIFENCGAYSMTEGNLLFLSRDIPQIYAIIYGEEIVAVRNKINSYVINAANV